MIFGYIRHYDISNTGAVSAVAFGYIRPYDKSTVEIREPNLRHNQCGNIKFISINI